MLPMPKAIQLLSLSGRDNFEKLYLKPAVELEMLELTIPENQRAGYRNIV